MSEFQRSPCGQFVAQAIVLPGVVAARVIHFDDGRPVADKDENADVAAQFLGDFVEARQAIGEDITPMPLVGENATFTTFGKLQDARHAIGSIIRLTSMAGILDPADRIAPALSQIVIDSLKAAHKSLDLLAKCVTDTPATKDVTRE